MIFERLRRSASRMLVETIPSVEPVTPEKHRALDEDDQPFAEFMGGMRFVSFDGFGHYREAPPLSHLLAHGAGKKAASLVRGRSGELT